MKGIPGLRRGVSLPARTVQTAEARWMLVRWLAAQQEGPMDTVIPGLLLSSGHGLLCLALKRHWRILSGRGKAACVVMYACMMGAGLQLFIRSHDQRILWILAQFLAGMAMAIAGWCSRPQGNG
jgi:hypothetical protein